MQRERKGNAAPNARRRSDRAPTQMPGVTRWAIRAARRPRPDRRELADRHTEILDRLAPSWQTLPDAGGNYNERVVATSRRGGRSQQCTLSGLRTALFGPPFPIELVSLEYRQTTDTGVVEWVGAAFGHLGRVDNEDALVEVQRPSWLDLLRGRGEVP